ncbi:MAG: sugar ABC transporter substrate-binding protein [Planctomycetota bacterium]|nr:sugar ABC transporter substrate-binding protein [Planctomycetota bacterium]
MNSNSRSGGHSDRFLAILLAISLTGIGAALYFLLYTPTFPKASETQSENRANSLQRKSVGTQLGLLYWSNTIEGQVAMRKGLEAELSRINEKRRAAGELEITATVYVAGDGEEGKARQIGQMNRLIDAKVDVIVVQPTDNAALATPLLRANKAGIPVVAFDQYISKGDLVSFLTSDNFSAGYECGEYLASRFSKEKTIRVVLVEYPHVSSTVERVNGFLDALRKRGQRFQIVGTYQAVEPAGGLAAGKAILKDFPKKESIDAIFTVNDGGGLNVVETLYGAGRTEILVATVDGDPRSVENIRKGRLTVIDCAQFCGGLGRESMKVAELILRGEDVPKQILIPVFPITVETESLYHGWNSKIPAPFDKSWTSDSVRWTWKLKKQ